MSEKDRIKDLIEEEEEDEDYIEESIWFWLWELFITWGPALLVVLVIRSVIAEPFRIPSGSMVPTLEIGDYILVNKFSYGFRVPFTPIQMFKTGEIKRGDIIVFKYPEDPKLDYIKRVVGLPGDEIMVRDNLIYVNGERQERKYLERYDFVDDTCEVESSKMFEEDISGVKHNILTSSLYSSPLANFGPHEIPPHNVFVMGDNRDNSSDSRRWGEVPIENIKGRALLIWLSYDHCSGGSMPIGSLRFDRFGKVLK